MCSTHYACQNSSAGLYDFFKCLCARLNIQSARLNIEIASSPSFKIKIKSGIVKHRAVVVGADRAKALANLLKQLALVLVAKLDR